MTPLPADTPILVVDDSAGIRAMMQSYLNRLGFANVRSASNVEEAMTAFREQGSEVVFLDLLLDEEAGADFAAQALEDRPFVTIVVTTALPSSHESVTEAIAEGAREFLAKPVRLPALKQVLEHIARQHAEDRRETLSDITYA